MDLIRIPSEEAAPQSSGELSRCSACATRRICVQQNVDRATRSRLEAVIQPARSLRRGQYLYCTGHALRYLFAVRSGAIKTVMRVPGGEHIINVHRPGDPLGLDGLATGQHALDAVATEDTSVCLIPYEGFRQMCRDIPAVQDRLTEIIGNQLVRDVGVKIMSTMQSVEARVAAFLVDQSMENARRGYSPHEFRICMTRAEMGNFLGTTLETVCRVMTALSRDGVIEVNGKQVRVLDFEQLVARLSPRQGTAIVNHARRHVESRHEQSADPALWQEVGHCDTSFPVRPGQGVSESLPRLP